jgi:uncharacterized protein with HEPN domain
MQPEDRTRILPMIEAGDAVAQFITGRSREALDSDRMLLFALTRAVEVFGEAAGKLSPSAKAAMPDVPWPHVVAMRNRLVEGPDGITLDWVVGIGRNDLKPGDAGSGARAGPTDCSVEENSWVMISPR